MTSLYQLKPAFQSLLRPLVNTLAGLGVRANGVTVAALLLSVALGAWLGLDPTPSHFLLLPAWMLLRMAFNAMDGMLAREHGQQTALGAYLNELSDVVADAALYLPFAAIAPFGGASIATVIFLAALSEMAGVLGPLVGAPRSYAGPVGKSDRALLFGALGLALGLGGSLPAWTFWLMPAAALGMLLNIVNRVRQGTRHARA